MRVSPRPGAARGRAGSSISSGTRRRLSGSRSASSRVDRVPPPQPALLEELGPRRGRAAGSAHRARARARYSSRSRNVGSAHWMSSNTITSGASPASARRACGWPRRRLARAGAGSLAEPERLDDQLRDQRRPSPRRRAIRRRVRSATPPSGCPLPGSRARPRVSGQNVMPSPYGRQRPCSTRASRSRSSPSELRDEARLADARLADHRAR